MYLSSNYLVISRVVSHPFEAGFLALLTRCVVCREGRRVLLGSSRLCDCVHSRAVQFARALAVRLLYRRLCHSCKGSQTSQSVFSSDVFFCLV